ncbi:hypothetical protein D3C83_00770 [compost metagenome]
MPRQRPLDLLVGRLVDIGDFGEGAAAARPGGDEGRIAPAARSAMAVREVARRIATRDHPLAVTRRATGLGQDAVIGIVEPHRLEKFHPEPRIGIS